MTGLLCFNIIIITVANWLVHLVRKKVVSSQRVCYHQYHCLDAVPATDRRVDLICSSKRCFRDRWISATDDNLPVMACVVYRYIGSLPSLQNKRYRVAGCQIDKHGRKPQRCCWEARVFCRSVPIWQSASDAWCLRSWTKLRCLKCVLCGIVYDALTSCLRAARKSDLVDDVITRAKERDGNGGKQWRSVCSAPLSNLCMRI